MNKLNTTICLMAMLLVYLEYTSSELAADASSRIKREDSVTFQFSRLNGDRSLQTTARLLSVSLLDTSFESAPTLNRDASGDTDIQPGSVKNEHVIQLASLVTGDIHGLPTSSSVSTEDIVQTYLTTTGSNNEDITLESQSTAVYDNGITEKDNNHAAVLKHAADPHKPRENFETQRDYAAVRKTGDTRILRYTTTTTDNLENTPVTNTLEFTPILNDLGSTATSSVTVNFPRSKLSEYYPTTEITNDTPTPEIPAYSSTVALSSSSLSLSRTTFQVTGAASCGKKILCKTGAGLYRVNSSYCDSHYPTSVSDFELFASTQISKVEIWTSPTLQTALIKCTWRIRVPRRHTAKLTFDQLASDNKNVEISLRFLTRNINIPASNLVKNGFTVLLFKGTNYVWYLSRAPHLTPLIAFHLVTYPNILPSGRLSNTSSYVTSPGFNGVDRYLNGYDGDFYIDVPEHYTVMVKFTHFNIEDCWDCGCDHLTIRELHKESQRVLRVWKILYKKGLTHELL